MLPIRNANEAQIVADALLNALPATKALRKLEDAGVIVSTRLSPVAEGTDEFWAREIAKSNAVLDKTFCPETGERPRKADDGLGKRVNVNSLREGSALWAPKGIVRFGPGRGVAIAAGSHCVVDRIDPDWTLWVTFTDAETGEVIRGDVSASELRQMPINPEWLEVEP